MLLNSTDQLFHNYREGSKTSKFVNLKRHDDFQQHYEYKHECWCHDLQIAHENDN